MLYYHSKVTYKKVKEVSVGPVNWIDRMRRITEEINEKGPENVRFYIVCFKNSIYVELCATIGYRNRESAADLSKEFVKNLGYEAISSLTREIDTATFAEYLMTAHKNGYVRDIKEILLRSTFGDYRTCTDGSYKEFLANGNLSKSAIYEKMEELGFSGFLKDEIDRIFSVESSYGFRGHPVHYVVFSNGPERRKEIVELLISALFRAGRLRSRRYAYFEGSSVDSFDSLFGLDPNDKLIKLYRVLGGATMVVNPCDFKNEELSLSETPMLCMLTGLISDNRKDILTIMQFKHEEVSTARHMMSDIEGVRFVEIWDHGNTRERCISILLNKASEDGMENTDSLISKLDGKSGDFTDKDLDRIYADWFDEQMGTVVYPQYASFERAGVSSASCEHGKKDDPYEMLKSLIGLGNAKAMIDRIIGYHKTRGMFRNAGVTDINPSYHMVFTGEPGTAKTTVARLFAAIMKDKGIISKGNLIEVGRKDLVGKYVGWTAKAVTEAFDKAAGSVLFIDEAYSLCDGNDGSYGDEAINTIVQLMENRRDDTVVIFAGYPDKMQLFLDRNPGLRSRIAYHVKFDDYSTDELMDILKLMVKEVHMNLNPESEDKIRGIFDAVREYRDFGNGRFVRNLFEQARMNLACRVSAMDPVNVSDSNLTTLIAADFEIPDEFKNRPVKRKMGF